MYSFRYQISTQGLLWQAGGGHQEISGAQDRYISAFTTLTAPEQGDKEAADWNSTWDEGEQSKFPLSLS